MRQPYTRQVHHTSFFPNGRYIIGDMNSGSKFWLQRLYKTLEVFFNTLIRFEVHYKCAFIIHSYILLFHMGNCRVPKTIRVALRQNKAMKMTNAYHLKKSTILKAAVYLAQPMKYDRMNGGHQLVVMFSLLASNAPFIKAPVLSFALSTYRQFHIDSTMGFEHSWGHLEWD